jgi:hypothetical protein
MMLTGGKEGFNLEGEDGFFPIKCTCCASIDLLCPIVIWTFATFLYSTEFLEIDD